MSDSPKDLAGDYVLTVGLARGGKHHRAGETVHLTHDDAVRFLEQGLVHPEAVHAAGHVLTFEQYMAKGRVEAQKDLERYAADYPKYVEYMKGRSAESEDSAPEITTDPEPPADPTKDEPPPAEPPATGVSSELTPPSGAELGDPTGAGMSDEDLEAATAPSTSSMPPTDGKRKGRK